MEILSAMGMFSWLGRSGRRTGSDGGSTGSAGSTSAGSTSAGSAGSTGRRSRGRVADDLTEWASRRRGVEVYVEPKTAVTGTSVLLVAHDGEFTRRRISSPKAAQKFAHANQLPIYDAMIVGYPQRMRDYSRRQNILRERAEREALGD
jgi:hypothetical protein